EVHLTAPRTAGRVHEVAERRESVDRAEVGAVLPAEPLEDLVRDQVCGVDPPAGVLVQVVVDDRPGVAHRVPVLPRVDRHPVLGGGGLLDRALELELPADRGAEEPAQLRAEDPLAPHLPGAVAADAERGGDVAHRGAVRPDPPPVADLDPERGAPSARAPEAELLPAGGVSRAAERPDVPIALSGET